MEYDREELLSALSDVRPALAVVTNKSTPELSHLWFDGDYVYANDGGLGMRRVLETDLKCGVPGKPLLDLLRTSSLKQVSITDEDGILTLQMGRSKVKLASLPGDRLPWPFPEEGSGTALELTQDTIQAMTYCKFVRIRGDRIVNHGVVIIPTKSSLEFYATDTASMVRFEVAGRPPKGLDTFVAPWEFVSQVLEFVEPGGKLYVMDDCLLAGSDTMLICSNRLEGPDVDLPKVLDKLAGPDDLVMLPIPDGITPVLERAEILAGGGDPTLKLTVAGSSLHLQGKYPLGSIDETIKLDGKGPEISAGIDAKLLRRGLAYADSFTISKSSIILEGEAGYTYVVAAKGA